MIRIQPLLAALGLLAAAAATQVAASGSASSASSEGSSASVGSLSTSVETSSDASSKGDKAAQGDYRIVDVAAAPARPGSARVTLQALADDGAGGSMFLYLPQTVADDAGLAPGGLISARDRGYGLEFAYGEPRRPFFLALHDDAFRELRTRPVTL